MLAVCSNWWNNYIWDILLANIGEHIPTPWSIWVKLTFKIHRNLKKAMKTRVKWWDGIEHGSIAGHDHGEIIVNMWGFTSKIWPILDIPLNYFTSSDPHPDTLFWRSFSFWHTIWTYVYIYIYCIYSDILSGIYSDIGSDIISGILSGMCLGPGVAHSRKGAGDMMLGSRPRRSPQEVREWGMRSCTFAKI